MLATGCGKTKNEFNGYIDTDMSYLSSSFSGRLQTLNVQRGDLVEASQKLFEVDPTYESISASIDQHNVDALQAEYEQVLKIDCLCEAASKGERTMAKSDASSKDDVDLALENLDVLNNQLKKASNPV